MGSIAETLDPKVSHHGASSIAMAYKASKAAQNLTVAHYAVLLRDEPFKVNACTPGLSATNFSGGRGRGGLGTMTAAFLGDLLMEKLRSCNTLDRGKGFFSSVVRLGVDSGSSKGSISLFVPNFECFHNPWSSDFFVNPIASSHHSRAPHSSRSAASAFMFSNSLTSPERI